MVVIGPISNLDKHQGITLAHDEIQLATATVIVAFNQLQALGLQPVGGD